MVQSRNMNKKEKKPKGPKTIFGYHTILDLYGCDHHAVGSLDVCYKYLDDMVELLKMHKQTQPLVFQTDPIKWPDKAGISGWVPVVESGISIHTLTPTDFVSIDVYSCKKYSADLIREFTAKVFKPKEIEEKFFLRGEKYVHPIKEKKSKKTLKK